MLISESALEGPSSTGRRDCVETIILDLKGFEGHRGSVGPAHHSVAVNSG